jgi:hypothetical protein
MTLYLEDLTRLVRTKTIECECGCWYWTGATTTKGYPKFELRGKTVLVYRYAYERLVGEIPDDMTLDHRNCTSHHCIRPDHMDVVTRGENSERANATRWHDVKFDADGNVVDRTLCDACLRRDLHPAAGTRHDRESSWDEAVEEVLFQSE